MPTPQDGFRLPDTLVDRSQLNPKLAPPTGQREVLMLKTTHGRDDHAGAQAKDYVAGETHPVGPSLFRAFVDILKVAAPVEAPAVEAREPQVGAPEPDAAKRQTPTRKIRKG